MGEGIATSSDKGGLLLLGAADMYSLEEASSFGVLLQSDVIDQLGCKIETEHPEDNDGKEGGKRSQGPVEPERGRAKDLVGDAIVAEEAGVEEVCAGDGDDDKPGDDAAPDKRVHDGRPIERVQSNLQTKGVWLTEL